MSLSYPTQRRSQCRTSLHATEYGPCPDGQATTTGLRSGRVAWTPWAIATHAHVASGDSPRGHHGAVMSERRRGRSFRFESIRGTALDLDSLEPTLGRTAVPFRRPVVPSKWWIGRPVMARREITTNVPSAAELGLLLTGPAQTVETRAGIFEYAEAGMDLRC
jgi:hypothetical protein